MIKKIRPVGQEIHPKEDRIGEFLVLSAEQTARVNFYSKSYATYWKDIDKKWEELTTWGFTGEIDDFIVDKDYTEPSLWDHIVKFLRMEI